MSVLYKYTSINNKSLNSLLNKYFYCPRPSQLNDPFDCYIKILHNEDDAIIQKWLNINFFPEICNVDNKAFPFKSVQDVKNSFIDGRFDDYVYKQLYQKDTNSFHVFCLSKTDTNPVLWNHYANSYEGMCIAYKAIDFCNNSEKYYGLKIQNCKFEYYNYFTKIDNKLYFKIHDVEYSDSSIYTYNCMNHIFSSEKNDLPGEFIWKSFHTKQTVWEYEKECRGIFTDNNQIKFDNKLYYEDDVLDSITFGFNVQKNAIDNIRKIVETNYKNSSNIKFYKISIDNIEKKLTKFAL